MRFNFFLALGLLFLVSSANAAEAPKGFRDFAWGAAPHKELKKMPVASHDDVAVYQPRTRKTLPPLFKVPVAEESYSFSNAKFFMGNAWVDGKENFEKIKVALIKTYGQPEVIDERKNFRIWKWPDSPIEVRLSYNEKFSRATITYIKGIENKNQHKPQNSVAPRS